MAEEQPIGAEGMGFVFDNAKMSSVQMSELSDSEMNKTRGANYCQDLQAQGYFIGCLDDFNFSPSLIQGLFGYRMN